MSEETPQFRYVTTEFRLRITDPFAQAIIAASQGDRGPLLALVEQTRRRLARDIIERYGSGGA